MNPAGFTPSVRLQHKCTGDRYAMGPCSLEPPYPAEAALVCIGRLRPGFLGNPTPRWRSSSATRPLDGRDASRFV